MDERVPNVFYFHVLLSFRTNKFQDGTNTISGCIYYDCHPYTLQQNICNTKKTRALAFQNKFLEEKILF